MAKRKISMKKTEEQVVIIEPKEIEINPPEIVEIRRLLALLSKNLA